KHDGKHLLICKGAVEEILSLCTHAFDPGEDKSLHIENDAVVPVDEAMHKIVLDTSEKMNAEGIRVILVAIREFDGHHPLNYTIDDESQLTLTGFIGFLDPAKPSTKPAIAALQKLNISIKVLTGDNEAVTRKICKDVGISTDQIINGRNLENMNDG